MMYAPCRRSSLLCIPVRRYEIPLEYSGYREYTSISTEYICNKRFCLILKYGCSDLEAVGTGDCLRPIGAFSGQERTKI